MQTAVSELSENYTHTWLAVVAAQTVVQVKSSGAECSQPLYTNHRMHITESKAATAVACIYVHRVNTQKQTPYKNVSCCNGGQCDVRGRAGKHAILFYTMAAIICEKTRIWNGTIDSNITKCVGKVSWRQPITNCHFWSRPHCLHVERIRVEGIFLHVERFCRQKSVLATCRKKLNMFNLCRHVALHVAAMWTRPSTSRRRHVDGDL